jgi:hypothetical protein
MLSKSSPNSVLHHKNPKTHQLIKLHTPHGHGRKRNLKEKRNLKRNLKRGRSFRLAERPLSL